MRGRWVVALALLAGLGLTGVQAQVSEPSSTLALTDQPPAGASAPSTEGCGQVNLYGLTQSGLAPAEETKAYTTQSSLVLSCRTLFWTTAPGAFNVTGDLTVTLFVGCDETTVMAQGYDNVNVEFTRNDKAIAEGSASVGPTCSPGTPMEAEVEVPRPEEASFAAGDTVGLNVSLFGSPDTANENLHVLVGGNDTISQVTVPGLSQAFEVDEEADEVAEPVTNGSNTSRIDPQTTTDDTSENGTPGLGTALKAILAGIVAIGARSRR